MYYLIDNDEDLRYDDIEEVLEYCVNVDYFEEDRDGFDEYLDCNGDVDVAGYSYSPSQVLREMGDYDDAISDWARDQVECNWSEYRWELGRLRDGQSCYVCNYEVYAYDDEEAEEDEEITEEVVEKIEVRVETQIQLEQETKEENKRLENEFMSVFQTLS